VYSTSRRDSYELSSVRISGNRNGVGWVRQKKNANASGNKIGSFVEFIARGFCSRGSINLCSAAGNSTQPEPHLMVAVLPAPRSQRQLLTPDARVFSLGRSATFKRYAHDNRATIETHPRRRFGWPRVIEVLRGLYPGEFRYAHFIILGY